VYGESEEFKAYVTEKNPGVNSYLIYFVNRNYGLIEVEFDL
jgi:hypothetical protein